MKEKKQNKKPNKNGLIYKVIIILLLCVIAFSLYKVCTIVYQYYIGSQQYKQVQEIAGTKDYTGNINWKGLITSNKDVKAWLYNKDTVINYPVVQGDDNSFYLTHMFNGEWNGAGSLFIDYRIKNPFSTFNTIIYGHRMKDGSMFHSLIEYRDEDYYNEHKIMNLVTEDARYDIEVFAAITIPSDSPFYKIDFVDDNEKMQYLNDIQNKTELKTDVPVTAEDKIVMMSTCTYEFDEARLVVYGRLIEK